MKIAGLSARWILDSRGIPTVECDVRLDSEVVGRAAVPSGASTGSHEALELRDGGSEFGGKGVATAISNIENIIAKTVVGLMADDQFLIDRKMIELDGTANKSRLGANAILAVSLACAHAAANERKIPLYKQINDIAGRPEMSLPMPMMNVLNGGKHATNSSDFQEYMIIPVGAESYRDGVKYGAEVFQSLKSIISSSGASTAVGDEGGFTFPVRTNADMLDLLLKGIESAGYHPGENISLSLDVAASELFENGIYNLKVENRQLSSTEMVDYLAELTHRYPLISIEDGLEQDDWGAWGEMAKQLPSTQLVGDDLVVTSPERLRRAIDSNCGNAVLIKPNQIGTLTETLRTIDLAKKNNWSTIISHRSGETEDVTIAHLAVGTGAGQIKTGSLSRSERNAKHNELMRIEASDNTLKLSNPFKL